VFVHHILGSSFAAGDPGVVDQNVDPAFGIEHGLRGLFDCGGVGHVEINRGAGNTRLREPLDCRLEEGRVTIRDGDFRPGLTKRVGAGEANPLPTAGDEGSASVEPQFLKIHGLTFQLGRNWAAGIGASDTVRCASSW